MNTSSLLSVSTQCEDAHQNRIASSRTVTRFQLVASHGFTLIELLMVITIISILAALLLPSLSRVKSESDSTVCRSNLHQWSLSLNMYLAEHGDAFPTDCLVTQGVSNDRTHWHSRLENYLGSKWPKWNVTSSRFDPGKGAAVCPGYGRFPKPYYDDYRASYGSYAYNAEGVGSFGLIAGLPPGDDLTAITLPDPSTKEEQIAAPSDMIALGDSTILIDDTNNTVGDTLLSPIYSMGISAVFYEIGVPLGNPLDAVRARLRQRHGERFNILLCDGHTENLPLRSLFDLGRDEVAKRWNRDDAPHREAIPLIFGP